MGYNSYTTLAIFTYIYTYIYLDSTYIYPDLLIFTYIYHIFSSILNIFTHISTYLLLFSCIFLLISTYLLLFSTGRALHLLLSASGTTCLDSIHTIVWYFTTVCHKSVVFYNKNMSLKNEGHLINVPHV